VFGDTLLSASNATSFAFLAGFIALGASRRPLLHAILVPTFLVLLLLDIFECHSSWASAECRMA
jgi:hypothetical protein